MKIAFLTEMNFRSKIPVNHVNMRTEFAWMFALDADHYNIQDWESVSNYDYIFIIFPKGGVFLNSAGSKLTNDLNVYSDLFSKPIVSDLKSKNKYVCSIQEGPTWYVNDFTIKDQFNFYSQLSECDILFAHNEYDKNWYLGLYPGIRVEVMPTLLIENLINEITSKKENKTIIGGNFSRWYGGFQSYIISSEFKNPVYVQTSHSSREDEHRIENLNIIPRLNWLDWMKTLSSFKYAVHMMPTLAAGTFSLNCAYFGIPCIGNIDVDTQRICFPELSFRPEDVYNARITAKKLMEDVDFYNKCSELSKKQYTENYSIQTYKEKIFKILKR